VAEERGAWRKSIMIHITIQRLVHTKYELCHTQFLSHTSWQECMIEQLFLCVNDLSKISQLIGDMRLPELAEGHNLRRESTMLLIQTMAAFLQAGITAGEIRATLDPIAAARAAVAFHQGITMRIWPKRRGSNPVLRSLTPHYRETDPVDMLLVRLDHE
jgi:hypothetical protein